MSSKTAAPKIFSFIFNLENTVKSSQNKKDLNDVTAAPFFVSSSQLPAAKTQTKNGVSVTSLRSFLFRDNFRNLG